MQQPFLPADFTLASSTALVGPYGSGKSEIALTLACLMARRLQARPDNRLQVALGDIDVLKPYFRAREAGEALKAMGVRLLAPGGSLKSADLPILTPELGCAAREADTLLVLDVGGDPAGARALGSLRDEVDTNALDLLLVLNRHRPFMESVESVVEQADKIQRASGLRLTGVVSNTHMMAETTLDDVALGLERASRWRRARRSSAAHRPRTRDRHAHRAGRPRAHSPPGHPGHRPRQRAQTCLPRRLRALTGRPLKGQRNGATAARLLRLPAL